MSGWLPDGWLLVSDIDGTLTGDDAALRDLMAGLEGRPDIGFAVASGRSPALIREAVARFKLNPPDLVISSVGSEMTGPDGLAEAYRDFVADGWDRAGLERALTNVAGLTPQGPEGQRPFKLSFVTEGDPAELLSRVRAGLGRADLKATLIHSHGEFLDVLPVRASKGQAVRFLGDYLGLSLHRIVVAGDSGNDADLLTCGANAVVVGNYSSELLPILKNPSIYVARAHHASGVLEGLRHFGVFESS